MMDMSTVIVPKSDQINADDLIAGPMTISITGVKVQPGQEQPVSIGLAGTPKVYRPCKSMARVLVAAWGADANNYVGRSLTLYRDPSVKWGGMAVGGIRISHMTDIDRDMTMMLTMTKQNRAPHKVQVLKAPVRSAPPTDAHQPNADTLAAARAAAEKGTQTFKKWWADNQDARADAKTIIDELQKTCGDADLRNADEPFGLPPINPNPHTATDPELMAQIEREAREESDRMAREAGA